MTKLNARVKIEIEPERDARKDMMFVIVLICSLIHFVAHEIWKARREHHKSPVCEVTNTYTNGLGKEFDATTGEQVIRSTANNEIKYVGVYSGKTTCNLTQNERDKRYQERLKKAEPWRTAIKLDDRTYERDYWSSKECIVGIRYKDLKTGELYVAREIDGLKGLGNKDKPIVYMNKLGFAVRPTDGYIKQHMYGNSMEYVQRCIDAFNLHRRDDARKFLDGEITCNDYYMNMHGNLIEDII